MHQIYKCSTSIFLTFLLVVSFQASFSQLAINYGTPLVTGLNNAVDVVNAGDSRLFIAQQNGLIRIYNGTTTLKTFLDLSGQGLFPNPLGGEQGLLSVAFHPGYATNRYFFVWYTGATGAVTLARYRASVGGDTAVASTGVVLLSIAKPSGFTNHNGGKLNFGTDGKLYIGTGDGGDGGDPFNNAQNPLSLLGKMLRLDVDGFATSAPFYAIPADNPFVTPGDGVADEIFALGLRNPWRWSFDRANGSMWIGDVGQGVYEEVNYQTAATASGVNYGWRCREGMHNYNGGCGTLTFTEPVFEYDHATGGQSITGGYVYRGTATANAALVGRYITTDYISGNVWIVQPNGSFIKQTTGLVSNISGFGEDVNGELYAVRRASNGGLYRLNLLGVTPVSFTDLSGNRFTTYNRLTWTVATNQVIDKFLIEYSTNGRDFTTVGEVLAVNAGSTNTYNFQHNTAVHSTVFYRIKIIDNTGSMNYSSIIRLAGTGDENIKIAPTYVTNNTINISAQVSISRVQLISLDGKIVYDKRLQQAAGSTTVYLPSVPSGIYILQVNGLNTIKREKLYIQQ